MRGDLTQKILETVAEMAWFTSDFSIAILKAGYGASGAKLDRELEKVRVARENFFSEIGKRSLYGTLQRLKRDGLIEQTSHGWVTTPLGRKKLKKMQDRPRFDKLPAVKSQKTIIVIFDIPEKMRRKREWLRWTLKEMGFKMIQKSVWMGKVALPQEFINRLDEMKILDFVDIFKADRLGTLN